MSKEINKAVESEKLLKPSNGILVLIINIALIIASILSIIFGHIKVEEGGAIYVTMLVIGYDC